MSSSVQKIVWGGIPELQVGPFLTYTTTSLDVPAHPSTADVVTFSATSYIQIHFDITVK